MSVACLIPTRGRPVGLSKTLASIAGKASAYVGFDVTDPALQEYAVAPGIVTTTFGGEAPTSFKWNVLACMAHGHDWLVLASDDVVFETIDWIDKLEEIG